MLIHIVAFDVPFPPDYGGAIDVFFRLKSLYEQGAKIILHCFDYGRGSQDILNKYCQEVHYYPRFGAAKMLAFKPFIAASRQKKQLLHALLRHDAPIIFEGIHCCAYLNHAALAHRKKWVRIQNIEQIYYKKLAEVEPNVFKKIFLNVESYKIKHYEKQLGFATGLLTISAEDQLYYEKMHKNAVFLPAFHQNNCITAQTGKGDYVLYHGNLSVGENTRAAEYILKNIVPTLPQIKFIFAGKNPTSSLKNLIGKHTNAQLTPNPTQDAMAQLVQNAHIHLLLTFQATGVKLKVLAALHSGRHCIANEQVVAGSGLEPLCVIANSPADMRTQILRLMPLSLLPETIAAREKLLQKLYSNEINAQNLLKLLAM